MTTAELSAWVNRPVKQEERERGARDAITRPLTALIRHNVNATPPSLALERKAFRPRELHLNLTASILSRFTTAQDSNEFLWNWEFQMAFGADNQTWFNEAKWCLCQRWQRGSLISYCSESLSPRDADGWTSLKCIIGWKRQKKLSRWVEMSNIISFQKKHLWSKSLSLYARANKTM